MNCREAISMTTRESVEALPGLACYKAKKKLLLLRPLGKVIRPFGIGLQSASHTLEDTLHGDVDLGNLHLRHSSH